jgi:hypothetical protein
MTPTTYYVAWWNLENLFDYEGSPRRTAKLRRVIQKDLKGWTPKLRDRKIAQLASVISQMNVGAGPDLLGVCEVENRFVLERLAKAASGLVGRGYDIVHADTEDRRGIDVAFLFDRKVLKARQADVDFHVVVRRNATREIVQVNFTTKRNRTWTVFGNHWPSRSGGTYESSGYRSIAGETLAYFHQRTLEQIGPTTPVLVMGDFNDEPFDASLVTHALSTRQRTKALQGDSPWLWNLMWRPMGAADGTFYFDRRPNMLDQFLINKNMTASTAPIQAAPDTVEILRFPGTYSTGKYPYPKPFGGMGNKIDQQGYSDHFPIGMRVTEVD